MPLSLRSASRRSPRMQSLFDHFLSLQASPSSRSPIPTVTALVSPSVTESDFTSITGGDDQADGGDARADDRRQSNQKNQNARAQECGGGNGPRPVSPSYGKRGISTVNGGEILGQVAEYHSELKTAQLCATMLETRQI